MKQRNYLIFKITATIVALFTPFLVLILQETISSRKASNTMDSNTNRSEPALYIDRAPTPRATLPSRIETARTCDIYTPVERGGNSADRSDMRPSTVYICSSSKAYAYHCKKSCRGLDNCQNRISEVARRVAEKDGYRECKLCYR